MRRVFIAVLRLLGALIGALAGLAAVQVMRLRQLELLPGHPGFYVNHVVHPSSQPVAGPRLRMAVLGDSTTAGVGVTDPEDSLPYRVACRVADAERRPVHVVSYGWAGARVADLPRQQLPRALEPLRRTDSEPFLPGADIVVIVIGANDAMRHTAPRRFREDLRATLDTVRASAPRARVVLAGIPGFRGILPGLEALVFLADQFTRLLRPISRSEAARAGVAFADLEAELPRIVAGRTDVLSSDNFHPSVVGYDAWAEVIFRALRDHPDEVAVGA